MTHNTLFLRLAGPMQSWGTGSRLQLRRTDACPSKSGVLGLLLCAMGVSREESAEALKPLVHLSMGVRVDRPGHADWDYHTAGAKIGIRTPEGKVKRTATTRQYETLLSRRQYLFDASFLVALRGEPAAVRACSESLEQPAWPVFLGRKCCIPSEPVAAGAGDFRSLAEALASVPWRPPWPSPDAPRPGSQRQVDTLIEHPPGSPPPPSAGLVYDVPRAYGYWSHAARWVVPGHVTVPVGVPVQQPAHSARPDPYGPGWDDLRTRRLDVDRHLCVFCKSPAEHVHHLDYRDVRLDTLRSLCALCHEACTILEYSHDMETRRIDPIDPELRQVMLQQLRRLTDDRQLGRRAELMRQARAVPGPRSDRPPQEDC